MSLVALEEHYAWEPVSADNVVGNWLRKNNITAYNRLYDRADLRLEQMDGAGIEFQILSLFDPGVQADTDVQRAIDLARRANDDLAETVRGKPDARPGDVDGRTFLGNDLKVRAANAGGQGSKNTP